MRSTERSSLQSIGSAGSILSIGSRGSVQSIGSPGSVQSIGSAGSILSAFSRWSLRAWRGDSQCQGRSVDATPTADLAVPEEGQITA